MIAAARIVVANDSGPVHIADALDIPLVGVFGPTRPEIVGPFRRMEGVIRTPTNVWGAGSSGLRRARGASLHGESGGEGGPGGCDDADAAAGIARFRDGLGLI